VNHQRLRFHGELLVAGRLPCGCITEKKPVTRTPRRVKVVARRNLRRSAKTPPGLMQNRHGGFAQVLIKKPLLVSGFF
jgi:hypothetical protein